MAKLLDELERAAFVALMQPWDIERNPTGYYSVMSASGIRVCSAADKPDVNLIVAAVNALPALLRVARAAQEVKATDNEYGYDSRLFELAMEELEAALFFLAAPESEARQ